jgi:hypothetical protein
MATTLLAATAAAYVGATSCGVAVYAVLFFASAKPSGHGSVDGPEPRSQAVIAAVVGGVAAGVTALRLGGPPALLHRSLVLLFPSFLLAGPAAVCAFLAVAKALLAVRLVERRSNGLWALSLLSAAVVGLGIPYAIGRLFL